MTGRQFLFQWIKKISQKKKQNWTRFLWSFVVPSSFHFSFFFFNFTKIVYDYLLLLVVGFPSSVTKVTKKISCHESNYIPQFKTVWLTRPRIIFILLVAPATSKIPSPLVEKWRNNPRFGRDCCSMRSGWMHEKSYQLRRKRNKPKPISVPVKD